MTFLSDRNPMLTMLVPVLASIITVVSRSPIHAILWLIATFLVTCGLLLYNFSLGFTCSLIIIVYIGAIAVLFLFIIMMVPIKERPSFTNDFARIILQAGVFLAAYVGGCLMFASQSISSEMNKVGEFWLTFSNQIDQQNLMSTLINSVSERVTMQDLYFGDLALYGARLYQEAAFPVLLTGLVLLFVLVAAIVLCLDE